MEGVHNMSHEIRANLEKEYTPMQRSYLKLTGKEPLQVLRMAVAGSDISHMVTQETKEYVCWLEARVQDLCKRLLDAHDQLASFRVPFPDEQIEKQWVKK